MNKFYIYCAILVLFLVSEILYFSSKDYVIESKLNFIEKTGMTSFAFNTQSHYQRHPYLHGINQIYTTHPAFREKDMASFVNSGKILRDKR